MSLFGSVLRDDFSEKSDVDVLADFEQGSRRSVFDLVDMEDELSAIFRRPVDLIEKQAIVESDNPLRRRSILESARVIYDDRRDISA